MIGKVVSTAGMSRERWLEERRKGIGGSDVAKIAGVSRWGTPLSVFLEKTGAFVQDEPGESAYWGEVLEDVVAAEFAKRTGLKVRRRNSICFHKDYPWMLANIDREVVGANKGLECKTTSAFAKDGWDGDELPDAYYLQVQHYIEVMGWESCFVACLIGGQRFIWKEVFRDTTTIASLIEIERDFWRRVEANDPPPLCVLDDPAMLYPEDTDPELLEPDDDMIAVAENLAAITERMAGLESDAKALQLKIKERIGEHAGIHGIATWRTTKAKAEVDMQRVAAGLASLIPNGDAVQRRLMEEHTTQRPGVRRFLFKYKPLESGLLVKKGAA